MRAAACWAFVLLAGCGFSDAALSARARFERTVRFASDGTFHLENVNGRVRVEPWDRPEVRIEAEKAASTEEYLKEIRIEVLGEGDHVDVRTRLPRGGFFLGGHGVVTYRIQLPPRASVEVKTVNGAVEVEGMEGPVRASTVNGPVQATEITGAVCASTVNGSIRAEYRRAAKGLHEFSTTNGSVTLYLPSDAGGEVQASTVNGGITTEFDLAVSGKLGGRRVQGRLGSGDASFRIRTVNGSVKLLKGGGEKVV